MVGIFWLNCSVLMQNVKMHILGFCSQVLYIEKIPLTESPIVGSPGREFETKGTHNIVVEAPGELAHTEIKRTGHLGIRYDSVPEWR